MNSNSSDNLLYKVEDLENRLAEAEQLIDAIKSGEVDAFAIGNGQGNEVYTLQSGDYAYRVLIERFGEGALNMTEDGLIVYSNIYFYEFLGLEYDKVVGTYIFDYIADTYKTQFKKLFSEALLGHSKGEINICVNDKEIPVYISLTSLQPNLPTVGMIITDLTEKKNNEKIIHGYQLEMEAKNRLLLNKNKQLEQQILNEFSESFSEYKTGSEFFNALTQSLSDKSGLDYTFIGELAQNLEDTNIIKTISFNAFGKLESNTEFIVKNAPIEKVIKGRLFSIPENIQHSFPNNEMLSQYQVQGFVGHPLYDAQHQPIGIIAVMHSRKIEDVSYVDSLLKIAAKRTEMEMERLRNETVLAVQNTELQNQNAELASFSYIASHDLQEPLRKIQAFTSRILEKEKLKLSVAGQDYFDRISDAAWRMQKLIEALLNYSRTNTTETLLESTDLNLLLEDVISELQEEVNDKNVKFETELLPTLDVVALQFHQLFSNIITNAIKYRKPNVDPCIKITSKLVPASEIRVDPPPLKSKYWNISFSDNGIGFEPQYESKVFELFQRLHGKKEFEGTGIGLAICKKIVQNHKGIIQAKGNPGKGATFHIYLPASD